MTYLTTIPLNLYRNETRKMIASRQTAHAAVLQSFSPTQSLVLGDSRVLWSLRQQGRSVNLVILSPERASPDHIVESCGWANTEDGGYQQVPYTPLVESISNGDIFRFTMTINPSVSKTGSKKRLAVPKDEAERWVSKVLLDRGAFISESSVTEYSVESFKHGDSKITLAIASITGTLSVENNMDFQKAMLGGIGRAKGYGCGLLMLDERIG